jgi:hypothetical protein
MQKLQEYPLTAIIDKKNSKRTNKLGTIKKFSPYLTKKHVYILKPREHYPF